MLLFWLFDIIFRNTAGMCFSAWILELFKPLFSAADGYLGLALIFGAMALFWFVGIHGLSVSGKEYVRLTRDPVRALNYALNQIKN